MLDKNDFTEEFKSKVQKVPESKYSVPIYIATTFIVLIWTYFINSKGYLCFSAILQATIALLVPLGFYKEKSVKKIAVVGVLSLLLLFSVFSAYNVHQRYNLSVQEVESDNLKNGTVDKLYGEGDEGFNFTVSEFYEEKDQNFSVYVNLTYTQFESEGSEFHEENYELNQIENNQRENGTEYYREITLDERLYQHHFVLKDNTTNHGNITWEETEKCRGPNTVPQSSTFLAVFILQIPYPLFIFLLLIGIVWWRRRMNKSKESSTEGLEKKEEELEDYCEKCGSFLEGEEVCPECGNRIVSEDGEKKNDKKENRIKCKSCGQIVSVEKEDCPYCGHEI